tara:strand:+ start:607 stop:1731 length:1125 start_codon:yes stop_codon:yes gene_type:complete
MNSPFEFGEIVNNTHFVNREAEKLRLKRNLLSGINTLLISPRRWGKSSLVKQVSIETKESNVRFCFIDLFHIKDEKEFYQVLAEEVIKSTSSKLDDWISSVKKFFKHIKPSISLGSDPLNDFTLSFEATEHQENYREILDLANLIAKDKKLRVVVCIDEFQNLSRFNDPLLFQQRLRATWQTHKQVSYCLYGSKKHMMIELFENKSMPFYKFGDLMFLEKIETNHWVKYIQKQFNSTQKSISKSQAEWIVSTVKNHSYYVQQLSLIVWYKTQTKTKQSDLTKAEHDLLSQNAILFQREIERLSNPQIGYLEALCNGVESFHSAEVINKYKLGSSSNVSRIKEALEKKEVIDTYADKPVFIDPLFELWFSKKYLK